MVTKEEVEARVEEGSSTLLHAGISLHRAVMSIETMNAPDAVSDLKNCHELLEEAIDTYRTVIAHASEGLLPPEERGIQPQTAEPVHDNLLQRGQLEGLFYHDEEAWAYLTSSATLADPLAGYERFLSMMTRVRNSVEGLKNDIEKLGQTEHVQHATWQTMTLYIRTLNFGQMIAFANKEAGKRR